MSLDCCALYEKDENESRVYCRFVSCVHRLDGMDIVDKFLQDVCTDQSVQDPTLAN